MAAYFRGSIWSLVLSALLALALVGCGDGKVNTNVDQSRNDRDETAPNRSDQFFMVPAGERDFIGNVTESVPLKVFLYETETGDAAEGQPISFEIVESDEAQEASLSALNSETGSDGSAAIDLRLGSAPGEVKVRANHESANAVDFTVDIQPLETGDLEITLENAGASSMQLNDIDLRLYRDGDYSCSEFRPLNPREDGELSTYVAGTTNETASFEDLGTRQRFMVTAIGRGDAGQIAGAGCIEDISIEADQVTTKELLLQLIPLNPVGRYDVTSHWDFSQAVAESGSVGSTIMRVLDIFENPGQALYDETVRLLRNFIGIGASVMDTFLSVTGLDDEFVDLVNGVVENNETLRRIRDAGRDLRDVIANLEVHSELTIGKMTSDYEFRGTDNWLGITLYWRWDCDENAPSDCGAINIEADGDGDFGELGVVSSEWRGQLDGYNRMVIQRHPISLRYGRLIMYILNEVILPEMTDGNAHSLSEAFTYWVCDGMGSAITGSDGEICAAGYCVTDDDISGVCENAGSTVFGFADLLVSNLEYDVGLTVGGEADLVETTSDGFVDFLENGIYDGVMQNSDIGQTQGSPVEATWSGERRDFDTDNL
ncbi:MAG: hypothetical protein ACOC9J_00040 [Persicimonas sp.]